MVTMRLDESALLYWLLYSGPQPSESMANTDEVGLRQPIALAIDGEQPKSAIVTVSAEHFITSEAENRGRGLALLLNRVAAYGTIRLREAALLYFPAVQQSTATHVPGGKPTRSAGPPGPRHPIGGDVKHARSVVAVDATAGCDQRDWASTAATVRGGLGAVEPPGSVVGKARCSL
ncbi:hypothetical protein [Nonomuraea sp. NPDC049141]|uniref:hypothetical protein n=1 Tax=Nonomuraea sp. NPDC049141 TaxID=3155500 RepID=UPI0033F52C55